ncbi:MAG: beta-lactamase family protein [Flavobacteriales bacterium]|nr:beta-lactamase family protein [Flavobacteriales bacterium]
MRNALFHFLSFGLLFSCANPAPVEDGKDLIQKVETGLGHRVYLEGDSLWTIEERMAHYGVPGVSIAVIKDNKIAWVKSYGVMDKETKQPVTDTTLFQAGSISKPVATYGALKLAELGLIGLDTDVNTQLRSWELPENEFTQEQKVTPKLLLGHMAGTTVHGFLGYSPDLPVPTITQVLSGEAPANSPPIVVDKLPGEGFRYSGGGYCIMQQLMMDAKGAAFPDIMDELVLRPLGMTRSTYEQPLTGGRLKMAATGYVPDGSMTKGKRHTYPEMAAAGLWTTAEDLAKYVIDLQRTYKGEKGAVLSKASAAMMLNEYKGPDAGVGVFLRTFQGEPYFEHGGWDEGFCAQFMAHRDKGYGVVVLINANQPDFYWELIRSVARAYNWEGYIPTYTKLESDIASLQKVSGRYRTGSDAFVTVSHKGTRLFKQTMEDEAVEIFRISDSTFISREDARPIQFKQAVGDSAARMLRLNENDGSVENGYPRMTDEEHIPFEFVLAGKPDEAVAAYRTLKSAAPEDEAVHEGRLNDFGYSLMATGKTVLARDIFYVNMHLYPTSSNVYDSYAEACLKNGEEELALVNYKKSFAMDPNNSNAARVIKELEGKKSRPE